MYTPPSHCLTNSYTSFSSNHTWHPGPWQQNFYREFAPGTAPHEAFCSQTPSHLKTTMTPWCCTLIYRHRHGHGHKGHGQDHSLGGGRARPYSHQPPPGWAPYPDTEGPFWRFGSDATVFIKPIPLPIAWGWGGGRGFILTVFPLPRPNISRAL